VREGSRGIPPLFWTFVRLERADEREPAFIGVPEFERGAQSGRAEGPDLAEFDEWADPRVQSLITVLGEMADQTDGESSARDPFPKQQEIRRAVLSKLHQIIALPVYRTEIQAEACVEVHVHDADLVAADIAEAQARSELERTDLGSDRESDLGPRRRPDIASETGNEKRVSARATEQVARRVELDRGVGTGQADRRNHEDQDKRDEHERLHREPP